MSHHNANNTVVKHTHCHCGKIGVILRQVCYTCLSITIKIVLSRGGEPMARVPDVARRRFSSGTPLDTSNLAWAKCGPGPAREEIMTGPQAICNHTM